MPWHQDLTIAVKEKCETAGFSAWTRKAEIQHVQPPIEILEKMLTLRFHLDDADESNGALKIIPKSHKSGRLSPEEIKFRRQANETRVCSVKKGDCLIMRPENSRILLLLPRVRKIGGWFILNFRRKIYQTVWIGMVHKVLLTILMLLSALNLFAQSGRNKPAETPTPSPTPRRANVYNPTEKISSLPNTSPTPKPKPKTDDDGEIIKVESNLVPIPASILDARGQMVGGLKLEDFQLQIDGNTVEIGELSRSETPVRLALLFDNSSSVTIAREFEKKAAVNFFRRVIRPDKDLVALFSVATVSRLEQPLTKDVSSLVQAIENFAQPAGATALFDGIIEAANYLKEAQGRRVIIIVSDGDDTISDIDNTLEKVLKTLQESNCQVYVVKTTDFENAKRTGQRTGSANLRQLAAERRMQEIAGQTGGAVYSPIDETELDQAFNQISAELAQQYILSYYPENESDKRGEFRTISLVVKTRQNLTVRTRKGYYVPRKN